MVRRLVEPHYPDPELEPTPERFRFWLRELRAHDRRPRWEVPPIVMIPGEDGTPMPATCTTSTTGGPRIRATTSADPSRLR